MSRDRIVNIEDVIKVLLSNDSHWTDLLRKINFDERLKIVQDAVNMVLPNFVDCVNKSLDSDIPRVMYIGCFDMVWQSIEEVAKKITMD
ncbi:MAG: hypothetical protein RXQ95_03075 [Vulcanisaeta sp.]|jgi:hypothetical protein